MQNQSELFCDGDYIKKELQGFKSGGMFGRVEIREIQQIKFNTIPQPSFNKQFDLLIDNLDRISQSKIYKLYFLCKRTTSKTFS